MGGKFINAKPSANLDDHERVVGGLVEVRRNAPDVLRMREEPSKVLYECTTIAVPCHLNSGPIADSVFCRSHPWLDEERVTCATLAPSI